MPSFVSLLNISSIYRDSSSICTWSLSLKSSGLAHQCESTVSWPLCWGIYSFIIGDWSMLVTFANFVFRSYCFSSYQIRSLPPAASTCGPGPRDHWRHSPFSSGYIVTILVIDLMARRGGGVCPEQGMLSRKLWITRFLSGFAPVSQPHVSGSWSSQIRFLHWQSRLADLENSVLSSALWLTRWISEKCASLRLEVRKHSPKWGSRPGVGALSIYQQELQEMEFAFTFLAIRV